MISEQKFEQQGLVVNGSIDTNITQLNPAEGINTSRFRAKIQDIRGGGFYGKTLIFKDSVIKTAQPDPWHEFWRQLNWDMPFPPQAYETAAILDHLSTTIINKTMPLRDVVTPRSYGYAKLGKLGFAQSLERMRGSIPQFNKKGENETVERTRRWIWELGKEMGIESAAQVHPNNPFGKPNIWIGENGETIWLDVLPAIEHTYYVKPLFRFDFHKDVRAFLGSKKYPTTFNRIHTDKMRHYLFHNRKLYSPSNIDEARWYLDQYDQYYLDYGHLMNADKQTQLELASVQVPPLKRIARNAVAEFIENMPGTKLFFNREARQNAVRFILDGEYRTEKMVEETFLRGAKAAYKNGLISYDKLEEFLYRSKEGDLKVYAQLEVFYFMMARACDILAAATASSAIFIPDPALKAEALKTAAGIFFILPLVLKPVSAAVVQTMTKTDMRFAILTSWLPTFGTYASVPAQAAISTSKNDELWHYTERWLVSVISKLTNPAAGGMGTDAERALWEKFEKMR
jgi:hypothetical protein